jgi:hypothetical protein
MGANNPIYPDSHVSITHPVRMLYRWWWRSRLRLLLGEFRSLASRLRWTLEVRRWENSGYRQPAPQVIGAYLDIQARNRRSVPAFGRFTNGLEARFGYLSICDICLMSHAYLEGWESGFKDEEAARSPATKD